MITAESFNRELITIAYFSTPTCSVCKVLRPKVEELADNSENTAFVYVNTEEEPELAAQNSVFTVPTVLVFVEGKESKRFSRSFSIAELEAFVERVNEIVG